MTKAHIAGTAPIPIEVKAGQSYYWCSCGLSMKQPFCDGSHKAEGVFEPIKFTADADRKVFFCTCKQSGKSPLCDGSHKTL